MSTKAVIFDMGRVLVNWDVSGGIFRELREVFGEVGERTQKGLAWERLYKEYATGKIFPRDFHNQLCMLTGSTLSFQEFETRWCAIFSPMPGMERLFYRVLQKNKVGLLSDTDPLHWSYLLTCFPWLGKIKNPTLSFNIGHLKPAEQCYQKAAKNLSLSCDDCFYIDDLMDNVQGARAAGMEAVQFAGAERLENVLMRKNFL
jgi:putative hydrolase of the HAD superfamily